MRLRIYRRKEYEFGNGDGETGKKRNSGPTIGQVLTFTVTHVLIAAFGVTIWRPKLHMYYVSYMI